MSSSSTTQTSINTNNTSLVTSINSDNDGGHNMLSMFDVGNINVIKSNIGDHDQSIANELSQQIQETDEEEEKDIDTIHSINKEEVNHSLSSSSTSASSDIITKNTSEDQIKEDTDKTNPSSAANKANGLFDIVQPRESSSSSHEKENATLSDGNDDSGSTHTQEEPNLKNKENYEILLPPTVKEPSSRLKQQHQLEDTSISQKQFSQSFHSRKQSSNTKKSQKKNSNSSNTSSEGQKMIFEKRKISVKPRTHSIQSVLSNVSSRNVLSRHSTHDDTSAYTTQEKSSGNYNNGSSIAGPIYDMMYNPSQQVQSPAMMTTLKKVRSNIQLNNALPSCQTNNLVSTLSNGHKRQHSSISNYSNNNNSSTNLAGLRGSYETDKVLIGERVPFVSRDDDNTDKEPLKQEEEESTYNNNSNDLQLTKGPSHKNNTERINTNIDDVINNDLIEWKNGSVTSMVSGTLTTYKPNRVNNNGTSKTANRTSNGSEVIEDDVSETDSIIEKKLTTDALKKLNLLQQQKKNRRKASIVSQASTNSSIDSPTRLRSYNSFPKRDNDAINEEQRVSVDALMEEENDNEYENTFGKDISSLLFFGKNIILDSTIVPRKHSLIPAINTGNEKPIFPRKKSTSSTENKKKQQQIDIPKKPLYTPAVLRDINETKISNDVLLKRALSPSVNSGSNNGPRSSSNASSMLETMSVKTAQTSTSTWSKLKNLFHATPSNPDLLQTTTASFKTPKQEPITQKHWVPDVTRDACFDCSTKFNLFDRRHHCRHCGEIFCSRHLIHYLYLNSQAHFIIGATGLGRLAKVCDSCLEKYEGLLVSGSGSLGVEEEDAGQLAGKNTGNGGIEGNGGGLPEDWYWSSF